MTIRRMKYNKYGLDIICHVVGTFNHEYYQYAYAEILFKPYGEENYIPIGKIYKEFTAPNGNPNRPGKSVLSWHHIKGERPLVKKQWHEAAKDLYDVYKKEAP